MNKLNNILYYNINSLLNKLEYVEEDIHKFQRNGDQVDIIAMTETKIYNRENGDYNIKNYRAFFKNTQGRYGGVALYVHGDLKYCREIFNENCYNVNMLLVSVPDLDINVGVMYKAPDVSMTDFLPILRRFLRRCNESKCGTIIVGDMNIDLLRISENHGYRDTIANEEFRILNKLGERSVTRAGATTSSIIDHVLTNYDDFGHKIKIRNTDLSDHKFIHIGFD